MKSDTAADADESLTNTPASRWEWLASLLASAVFITFLGLVVAGATGMASLGAVTQPWFLLLATLVLSAAAYAWGKDMIIRWKSGE